MKNHLKRPIAPKTWNLLRKTDKFVARPHPGAHSFEHGVPLIVLFRDMINTVHNAKEAKYMLTKYSVMVDGRKRKDVKHIIGLMDTVSLPDMKQNFRIILNHEGKLDTVAIDEKESKVKACKITGKKMNGKKIQLTTHDGRTILVDSRDYNTGDTIIIELPSQKVTEHFKLEPKMTVYLVGGKHAGSIGHIENVEKNKLSYKSKDGHVFETLKEYAFVIGKAKPAITIMKEN